jgi:hypothetical protein
VDNCPTDFNPGQTDTDSDGPGDTCDPCRHNPDPLCEECPEPDVTDPDGDGICQIREVLVQQSTPMDYLANAVDPGIGLDWVAESFSPGAGWQSGIYGVGFETGTGAENLISTTVPAGSVSVYTRATFELSGPVDGFQFHVAADYDDGYVAWINGVEVFRSPEVPPGAISWDTSPAIHESSNAAEPHYGTLVNVTSTAGAAIHTGSNTLAVGVWNSYPTSSDLVLVPWLSVLTSVDNCPDHANPGQEDSNGNGLGDACDPPQ